MRVGMQIPGAAETLQHQLLLKGEGAIRGDGVNEADNGGVSARLEAYEKQVECRRKRWRRQAE